MKLGLAGRDKHGQSKHERLSAEIERIAAHRGDDSILDEIVADLPEYERRKQEAEDKEREWELAHPNRFRYNDRPISEQAALAIFRLWAAGESVTNDNIDRSVERSIAISDDLPREKQRQSAPFKE